LHGFGAASHDSHVFVADHDQVFTERSAWFSGRVGVNSAGVHTGVRGVGAEVWDSVEIWL